MDQTTFKNQVLKRYSPDFANVSVKPYLRSPDEGIEQEFISTLTRAFEEDINFRYSEFNVFPVKIIIDYIRRTHQLYMNKTLQEIEQSLYLLNQAYRNGHQLLEILNRFYISYKSELIQHIREEDENLIPYIIYLDRCRRKGFDHFDYYQKSDAFDISHFFETHEENDAALEKIRRQILSYDPPRTNRYMYGVLLNQLELFEQDLKIHGMIEEQVLIPRALEMQRNLTQKMMKIARMN